MERGQRTVRLSEYIYVLMHQGKSEDSTEGNPAGPATVSAESQPPPSAWSLLYGKPILCRPQQLNWRRDVMVHFVVPGEIVFSISNGHFDVLMQHEQKLVLFQCSQKEGKPKQSYIQTMLLLFF